MFGMMGFGGGRNPRMRNLRIGLIVFVVLAGIIFHHSGPVYDVIRVLYFAAIIGFIVMASRARRAAGPSTQSGPFGNLGNRRQGWGGYQGPQNPQQTPIDANLVDPVRGHEGGSTGVDSQ